MSSFLGIVALVLVALIILSLLFVFFKAFLFLLPVAIIAVAIIWLVSWISRKRNKNAMTGTTDFSWFKESSSNKSRKPARNVTTKDIDK